MKLRNKKTGEIGTLYQWGENRVYQLWVQTSGKKYEIKSLAELNEEWDDYKGELRLVDSFDDDSKDTYLLTADFTKREVRTNCGDFYYDYSIGFDDFIKFANLVDNKDKMYNGEVDG